MAKVGSLLLPILSCLGVLGAATPSYAQEKLVATPLVKEIRSNLCPSTLQVLFVVSSYGCKETKITQLENAIKLQAKKDEEPDNITYEVESTYYVPPTPTPSLSEPTPTPTVTLPPPTQTNTYVPAEGPNVSSDTIFELINSHRASIGKPAFQKDEALCSLAQIRSVELHGELFEGKGRLHSGLYNRNLPYWITEDAKWGSDAAGTVNWWLNSPIHRHAIEGEYTYSCGACTGSQCSQLFTSYTPKS